MTKTRSNQKINSKRTKDDVEDEERAQDDSNELNFETTNLNSSSQQESNVDNETNNIVIEWIRSNYIEEREHNVPRNNMFEHYKSYCSSSNLTPINSATFGKLLRAVFPDLKTRRLGVRGQSKYHYCGIRVRNQNDPVVVASTPDPLKKKPKTKRSNISPASIKKPEEMPSFIIPSVPTFRLNYEIDSSTITSFTENYESHCREILQLLSDHEVAQIRDTIYKYYAEMPLQFIKTIHSIPEIIENIWRWDCTFYDTIIHKFLPTVNHILSKEMSETLNVFTRELNSYIEKSLTKYPTQLVQKKLDVARIFSAKLRRQLSLNIAAQNASAILNNTVYLDNMKQDWNKFDFDTILDQTLWVCDCDTSEIRYMLCEQVHELLTTKKPILNWMNWVGSIVNKYLKSFSHNNTDEANLFLAKSKQLLLKWNFYTTLIMKYLTLQQANSFDSFQNLRLFLDDYMLYLVEENIAQINCLLISQSNQSFKGDLGHIYARSSSSVTGDTVVISPSIQNNNMSITDINETN